MKKLTVILLLLALSFSLFACGKSGDEATTTADASISSTQPSDAPTSDATEPETTAPSDALRKGDSGNGPATLDAGLVRFEVPEDLGYTVDSLYIDEDNPFYGSVSIQIRGENGHIAAKLIATTQNMVSSQKEAVENVISLRNLDSYKEGKSSVGGDTVYCENTYTLVKISTENYEKDYFVAYIGNRSETDKNGLLVSLEVDLSEIASDSQQIKDLLSSVTVVKE